MNSEMWNEMSTRWHEMNAKNGKPWHGTRGVKFHYIGLNRNNSVITAATFVNFENKKMHVAFAYCGRKDRFDKETAKKISFGRLMNGMSEARDVVENNVKTNNDFQMRSSLSYYEVAFHGNSFEDVVVLLNTIEKRPVFCRDWRFSVVLDSGTGKKHVVLNTNNQNFVLGNEATYNGVSNNQYPPKPPTE